MSDKNLKEKKEISKKKKIDMDNFWIRIFIEDDIYNDHLIINDMIVIEGIMERYESEFYPEECIVLFTKSYFDGLKQAYKKSIDIKNKKNDFYSNITSYIDILSYLDVTHEYLSQLKESNFIKSNKKIRVFRALSFEIQSILDVDFYDDEEDCVELDVSMPKETISEENKKDKDISLINIQDDQIMHEEIGLIKDNIDGILIFDNDYTYEKDTNDNYYGFFPR